MIIDTHAHYDDEQFNADREELLNSMEEKLNKTIDMLNNMQDYLVENRIIARRTSKLIDGRDITDEELAAERLKLEAIKNGK